MEDQRGNTPFSKPRKNRWCNGIKEEVEERAAHKSLIDVLGLPFKTETVNSHYLHLGKILRLETAEIIN